MADPAISVVVPVYDVAGYVGPCLDSLKAQSFADFEAIVVDDGSSDESLAEARAAAAGDPRFRIVRRPNGGLSAARNTGLAEARGDFLAFLDSDDRVAPDWLARLHAAVTETGADWAACAVRLCPPEGAGRVHSAIHGRPHPVTAGRWTRLPLDDWRAIVPIWPSAWNKLYRRSLVAGMRFAEGLAYEDHPWFEECAARADALIYVPEPLYLQTQGRAGQITRDGSDTVFDQFPVLERAEAIMAASDKPGARAALAMLASRLTYERSGAIAEPGRRRRFADAAARFLADRGLAYAPDWDPAVAHAWGLVLAGETPLTVVVPTDGAGPLLDATLAALGRRTLPDTEILVVQAGTDPDAGAAIDAALHGLPTARRLTSDGGVAAARNAGLDAARGRFVVFLDAGDSLIPRASWLWVEGMLRHDADMGLSQFRVGGPRGRVHAGSHDGRAPDGGAAASLDPATEPRLAPLLGAPLGPLPADRALRLHALPSARIFRRAFLAEAGLRFPDEPLSAWQMVTAAALAARRLVAFPWPGAVQSTAPGARRLWQARAAPATLRAAVERLGPALDPHVPRADWLPVLLARAFWEKANFAEPDEAARTAWLAAAAQAAEGLAFGGLPPDPFVGPRIRALFAPAGPAPRASGATSETER